MMTRAQLLTCQSYWLRAKIGDRVCLAADPRHAGRLERVSWSQTGRVRWDDGMLSELTLQELWPVRAQQWL